MSIANITRDTTTVVAPVRTYEIADNVERKPVEIHDDHKETDVDYELEKVLKCGPRRISC
jgi:hypothetical protein